MKTTKLLIVAVIFFLAGFLLGQSYQLPFSHQQNQPTSEQPDIPKVVYRLQFSDSEMTEFQNVTIKPNETVMNLLKRLTEENNITLEIKDYEGLGSLVTKIGDKQNGQDNKYWQFFVNGQYAQIGADQYQLQGNDDITWKFTSDQSNN